MKRVNNSDINFLLNPKLVNLANFTIKFYTTSPESFFIRKTQDDVKTIERLSETEETCVDYYLKLDWIELVTLGEGVLQYQLTNNYEDGDRADDYYNVNVERTTNYYIDSNVIVDEDEAESYSEIVAELGDKIDAEIVRSESADTEQLLALNAEIQTRQNQVDNLLDLIETISGDTDMSNYYKKSETSGATEISTALDDKLDVSAYTPVDLTNYYTKSETSGASEISTALDDKLDVSAYTPTDLSNYYTKSETSGKTEIATALDDKLDVTAYTPTDLSNYYTKSETNSKVEAAVSGKADSSTVYLKSETSGATEISTALNDKLDVSAYTPVDLSDYYTKSETSGATQISSALSDKLDVTAYTPTDLSNYYTKSETSGATQISTALDDLKDIVIEDEEVTAAALNDLYENKLDISAYTPVDLTNYYTKSETSGKTELSTAFSSKADSDSVYLKTETSGASQISTALSDKQNTLVSAVNIKTINNESVLGSGNIDIQGGGKAVSAGTNISITTGETADTINCTLPIKVTDNNANSIIIGNGSGNDSHGNNCILAGASISANFENCICVGSSLTGGSKNTQVFGDRTRTSNEDEHTTGRLNISNKANNNFGDSGNTLFSVGNGYYKYPIDGHHNAFEIRQNGDIYIADTNDTTYQNYYEKPMIKLQDQLGGSSITIDPTLDNGSTNPVANSAITAAFDNLNDIVIEDEEVTAAALNDLKSNKLDVSAYTPVDLTNYYTKSETSGKTELSTAFNGKLDVTAYTPTDLSNYYTKSETSGASQISTALNDKQNTLSAGTGIVITNNVISTTGGGGSVNVVQTTGTSTADVMSQDAVTTQLNNKANKSAAVGGYKFESYNDAVYLQYTNVNNNNIGKSLYYAKINGKEILTTNRIYAQNNYNFQLVETSAITTSISSSSTDLQVPSAKAVNDKLGGLSLVKLTQSEYDALATKDNNTLYIIV